MTMLQDAIKPDLVLLDGNVLCMNSAKTVARAVAVKDKKIIAVGSSNDIRSLIGKNTQVINLAGRTVVPGFTDGHVHVEWYGKDQLMLNFSKCKTEEEAVQLLKKKVEQTKPGEWVAGCAVPQGVMAPGEGGFTRKQVDPISLNNPVYIDCASVGHYMWINGSALKLFNITRDTYPKGITGGGGIVKDTQGEPTGRLEGDAWNWALREIKPYSLEWYLRALETAQAAFLKVGVTAAHNAWEDPYIFGGWQTFAEAGKLRMRQFISFDMERYSDTLINAGLHTGFGNDMLRLQQFKIILNVPPLAAVFEDYVGMPGNRGYHLYPPEWVEEKTLNAVKHGWSVCSHVTADADTDMVVTAYEKALGWYKKETGKDNTTLRLRLEHCSMPTPSIIKRIAAAKIVVNIEPTAKLSSYNRPGGGLEKLLGHDRWERTYPTKALIDAGVNVNFGSDYPMPFGFIDPRANIFASIDSCGRPWDIIPAYQAIEASTINGAYGVFSENKFGSIEAGKFADMVVFSDNPLTIPKEKIWNAQTNLPGELQIDYTIVNGKVEHRGTI